MYRASCLCAAVQLQFEEIVGDFVYCHCRSCRKASGSAFAANVAVPGHSLTFIQGEDQVQIYESSPGKERHFCGKCGSPLFTRVGKNSESVRIRLGILDTRFEKQPSAHIFTGHKAAWEPVIADIPQHEEWPPAGALRIVGSRQPEGKS